ncbi:MAG: SMI1/KNR4 family protein [Zavarzinella sp.]
MKINDSKFKIDLIKPVKAADHETITQFEEEIGNTIPIQYREFLLQQNGGKPKLYVVKFGKRPYDDAAIDMFLGVKCKLSNSIKFFLEIYQERIPEWTLPIASEEGDNLFLISTRQSDNGAIFFWDHEKEQTKKSYKKIAKDLYNFLQMLHPPKLIEYQLANVVYDNGVSETFLIDANFWSVSRNKVVAVSELEINPA